MSAYHSLVFQENLDTSSAGLAKVDFGDSCEFMPVDPKSFYYDTRTLTKHQDASRDELTKKSKAKKMALRNPVLSDGSIKLSHPKKLQDSEARTLVQAKTSWCQAKKHKHKTDEDQEADAEPNFTDPSMKR
ncbi:hypothetical protein DFS33DRAFT_1435562 [Desarmillaria ectypa]|nr:hypothetical protein DFS33DRAFT_1435562 [Desarmillaria ectypa]